MWQDVSLTFLPIFDSFAGNLSEAEFWHGPCIAFGDRVIVSGVLDGHFLPDTGYFRSQLHRAARPRRRSGADDPYDHSRNGRDAGRGTSLGGALDRRQQGNEAGAGPAAGTTVELDRKGRAGTEQ